MAVMASSETTLQNLKVDFSGLRPNEPGTPAWCAVRSQIMQAIQSHGWFEAVYDKISPGLHDELFGTATKQLFSLPAEIKSRNISDKANHGYIGQIPGMAYEGLCIEGAHLIEDVGQFATLMWPQGNPNFCKTVHDFVKLLSEVEQMVRMMILERLGVADQFDQQNGSMTYALRFAKYGPPEKDQMAKMVLMPHADPTTISIVCQHRVEGLEVPTKNGEWIRVSASSPNSFIFLIGEAFEAWSNGRVRATVHRVCVRGNETRYSVIMSSRPQDGHVIRAPEELIDDAHPLIYKPFDYASYVNFRYSEAGRRAPDVLQTYCGVHAEEAQVRAQSHTRA